MDQKATDSALRFTPCCHKDAMVAKVTRAVCKHFADKNCLHTIWHGQDSLLSSGIIIIIHCGRDTAYACTASPAGLVLRSRMACRCIQPPVLTGTVLD